MAQKNRLSVRRLLFDDIQCCGIRFVDYSLLHILYMSDSTMLELKNRITLLLHSDIKESELAEHVEFLKKSGLIEDVVVSNGFFRGHYYRLTSHGCDIVQELHVLYSNVFVALKNMHSNQLKPIVRFKKSKPLIPLTENDDK